MSTIVRTTVTGGTVVRVEPSNEIKVTFANGPVTLTGGITALTGDVTASGTGSVVATLATVNSNVGTFGSVTKAGIFTVNAKGLVTAASESTVTPVVGSITGLGTGVATALAVNIGSAGAPVLFNGAGGTPTSLTGTNISGTAASLTAGHATALATGRTLAITGDLAWTSPSFDGSSNVAAVGTLATVASAGTTGGSTAIPVVTIDAKGRTTGITTAAVIAPAGTLTGATLASSVLASSLTSVGTLTGGATGAGFTVALGTSTLTGRLPFANLTQGSALSVLGVTGNATADFASIAAGTDNQVFRRSGTSLAFGAVDLASSNAVTGDLPYANLTPSSAASKLLGRGDSGAGDWQEITLGTNLSFSGTTLNASGGGGSGTVTNTGALTSGQLVFGNGGVDIAVGDLSGDVTTAGSGATIIANDAVTTAKILDANVTFAKIQLAATNSVLIGSGDSGSGAAYTEIVLGSNLSMSGTTLNATGGGGGSPWVERTSNYTAVSGDQIIADTAISGAFTIKMPATPSDGDYVWLMDNRSNWNGANLTVDGNGHDVLVEGVGSPVATVALNISQSLVGLVYESTDGIWIGNLYLGYGTFLAGNYAATTLPNNSVATTQTGSDNTTKIATTAFVHTYAQPLDSDLTSWAAITRASGFDTFTATPSGANLASLLTSALPATKGGTGLTSLGTGVATALAVNIGSAGAPVLFNGAGGTPSSIGLANGTGLPSIVAANEATDTTCFLSFFTAATGELGPKTNAAITFNSNTGVLTASLGSSTATTQSQGDNSNKLATTGYVDAAFADFDLKDPVVCATTTALLFSPSYSNGSSGVGATLTGSVGTLVIDGVTPALNNRILVKNEASTLTQGIYTLTTLGTISVGYVLTRATDFNQAANILYGDSVGVLQGTANANQQFTMNNQNAITVGTTAITFAQTSGGSQLSSGNGITITGNSVAINTAVTADVSTAQTLTNKRITRRIETLTDAATVTPNMDSYDGGLLTSLSQTTTFANPSGTPTNFQQYVLRVKSSTTRSISFGAQYRGSTDLPLPSATTGSSLTDYMMFQWNSADSKLEYLAKNFGF